MVDIFHHLIGSEISDLARRFQIHRFLYGIASFYRKLGFIFRKFRVERVKNSFLQKSRITTVPVIDEQRCNNKHHKNSDPELVHLDDLWKKEMLSLQIGNVSAVSSTSL